MDIEEKKLVFEEYKEIGVNWRYWGKVRFRQLAAFLTVTGVLGAGIISNVLAPEDAAPIRALLALMGLLAVFVFFFLEERASWYRRAFMSCALGLELPASGQGIGPTQYLRTKNPWPIDSPQIYRLFFSAVAGTWMSYLALLAFGTHWTVLLPLPVVSGALYRWARSRGDRFLQLAAEAGSQSLAEVIASRHSAPTGFSQICADKVSTDNEDERGKAARKTPEKDLL